VTLRTSSVAGATERLMTFALTPPARQPRPGVDRANPAVACSRGAGGAGALSAFGAGALFFTSSAAGRLTGHVLS
jgi:hypothetical protein